MAFYRSIHELITTQGIAKLYHYTLDCEGPSLLLIHGFGSSSKIWFQYPESLGNYLKEQAGQRFSGAYFLRTDRTDLSEKTIWSIYVMLTQLEDAFRTLKTDLQLRPVFHQKEHRSEAHIFITLLAYHLLHSIRCYLKQKDIRLNWSKLRDRMSTHCRITNRLRTQTGDTLFIRKCSQPEDFHKMIYDALGLDQIPCKTKNPAGKRLFPPCAPATAGDRAY